MGLLDLHRDQHRENSGAAGYPGDRDARDGVRNDLGRRATHWRGREPFATGVKRIILLVVILGGALNLWLYNDLIVDTFFRSPGELYAGVIGAYDSVGIIDQIIFAGGDAASLLIQKGGIFNGDFSYYLAGFSVYFIVGVTAIYAMFLLALSKIAVTPTMK